MFRDLPSPVALEEEVLEGWKRDDVFQKSLEARKDAPRFVFYEGPPTANGTPHNGHVLTRVIKDLFPRYKTMRGFRVDRMAGWDTHGLPVEIEVEKELGVRAGGEHKNARDAVVAYGLDRFARKCVESVFKYTTEWETLTERVGFWVNLDDAYVTYHRSYVESVWWALAQLHDRGLLYLGHKSVWWWPEGGTALSAHEVGEGYRDVEDPSVTVRFAVVGQPDTYLLAWTTTPWTLPSNVALAVNAELDYAFVRTADGQTLIAADALKPEGEVLKVCKGAELVGMTYEPLYPGGQPSAEGRRYVVVAGSHVTLDAGSGIVHTAPGYGEADFDLGKAEGLALIQLVGSDGHFVSEADGAPAVAAGMYFKAADKPIMADLTERGLMFHKGTVRHSYPFSPRSKDDPLLQLARPGWFIKTTAFKEAVLANNATVNWMPEHIKEGRFGDFLRNNVDWALSRERFWGTPLPIWTCATCDAREAFPSMKALRDRGATGFDESVDEHLQIHKPWVDRIEVPCRCGASMTRVPEVIDCWFDSGCMPFAQFGFPHQGVEAFRAAFPADFISEAVDQTRGWFYSLMMISTMLFDERTCKVYGLNPTFPLPYRNCIVLGHVGDMDGKKESKSIGNYTSPDLVLRGRMKMRVVADPSLTPGTAGLVAAAVRSIDLSKDERMGLSKTEDGARIQVQLKGGPSRGKETLGLHPDDIAQLGLDGEVWVHAPFTPPGADAFRWLFYASNPPWTNTRLSLRAIREGQREFHLRLGNVFSFFTIYANIARFDPAKSTLVGNTNLLDRWVLAELDDTVRVVTEHMDRYALFEASKAITAFVDGLSNWYVRRSRARFWGEGSDTLSALWTLYSVLTTLSKLIAPFVPFLADAMYTRLVPTGGSVHLASWPTHRTEVTPSQRELQDRMALIRELASLGLSARSAVGVRVRQPLRAAEIVLADPSRADGLAELLPLLEDELNVREVRFSAKAEEFVDFVVKPNFKSLGARLGKDMKACAAQVTAADPATVRNATMGAGFEVTLPSGTITLTSEDVVVEVRPKAHFQAAGSANAVVALHADLDDDLREEGLSREVINRVQTARKDLQLGYTDRIRVHLQGDPALVAATTRFAEHVKGEVLAVELVASPLVGEAQGLLDEHPFSLAVTRA